MLGTKNIMPALVETDVAELVQRVQTTSHGGARKSGRLGERPDRAPPGSAGKRTNDGEAARERRHEVGIAGESAQLVGCEPAAVVRVVALGASSLEIGFMRFADSLIRISHSCSEIGY